MKKIIGVGLVVAGLVALGLGLMQIPRITEAEEFVENAQREVDRQEQELEELTAEAEAPAESREAAARQADAIERTTHALDDRMTSLHRQQELVEERQTYFYTFTPAGLLILVVGIVVFRSATSNS